jgi:hypothetical protein
MINLSLEGSEFDVVRGAENERGEVNAVLIFRDRIPGVDVEHLQITVPLPHDARNALINKLEGKPVVQLDRPTRSAVIRP